MPDPSHARAVARSALQAAAPRASFAVRKTGPQARALFLTPCPAHLVGDALRRLGVASVRLPGQLWRGNAAPIELVAALPGPLRYRAPTAEVMIHRSHGVVRSRSEEVLEEVLRSWLEAYLQDRGVPLDLRGVDGSALRLLLAGGSACWVPCVMRGRRVITLSFRDPAGSSEIQWFGSDLAGWRTSWTVSR